MSIEAVICDGRSSLVSDIQVLRKKIFVDRCRWQLQVAAGREVDEFDTSQTVHLALYENGELKGTFRANRTDRPYLASRKFSSLATTAPYPCHKHAWEISRFGVSEPNNNKIAMVNYAVMFHLCAALDVSSLVAIADPTYERFLRTLGIRTRRYGPPAEVGKDLEGQPIIALAGEIHIPSQKPAKLAAFSSLLQTVEITDASNVFGPARVSA